MMSQLNQSVISATLGQLVGFGVLVWLTRWMFGYPKIMQKAFKRSELAAGSDEAVQDDD